MTAKRPLVVSVCSVIARRYLGLGCRQWTLALMQRYRDICHRFSVDFTLLWHRSHLGTEADRRLYRDDHLRTSQPRRNRVIAIVNQSTALLPVHSDL